MGNQMMKKLTLMVLMLGVLAGSAFALNEDVVMYEQLYKNVASDEQRVNVLLQVTAKDDREFIPFLDGVLDTVVASQFTIGTVAEREAKIKLAKLAVQELGDLNSRESAELIFSVYTDSPDPVLKNDAALALGKIRATEYAPRLAVDLNGLNNGPVASKSREQETVAAGLVSALAAMRDESGYEAVFLASQGWYSSASRIRSDAKAALLDMMEDPTDSLLKILESNPSIDIKVAALEASYASRAPAPRKALVAKWALRIGIDRVAQDVSSRMALVKLRVAAMNALIGLSDKGEDVVPVYIELIRLDRKNDASLEETLKAYQALGVNGGDEAVRFLSTRLSEYNVMEKVKGNTVRDKSLIRQIIASIAASGNPLGRGALQEARFIDYDAHILRALDEALKSFPN